MATALRSGAPAARPSFTVPLGRAAAGWSRFAAPALSVSLTGSPAPWEVGRCKTLNCGRWTALAHVLHGLHGKAATPIVGVDYAALRVTYVKTHHTIAALALAAICVAAGFVAGAWWARSAERVDAVAGAAAPAAATVAVAAAPTSGLTVPAAPTPEGAADAAPGSAAESGIVPEARTLGDVGLENPQVAIQAAAAHSASDSGEAVSSATGPTDQRSMQPSGEATSPAMTGPPSTTGGESSQRAAQPGDTI